MPSLIISTTSGWCEAYPGAAIGLLEIRGVDNRTPAPRLEEAKQAAQARLRMRYQGFTRTDLLALPVMATYARYYRHFGKTYHVLLQLESVVMKGRDLPNISPLVDAVFCAELETLVLTAGHDADRLRPPLSVDVAGTGATYIQPNGEIKSLQPGDMLMRDADGVSCSIIYGQDHRSLISPETTHVLYVAYAPAGVPTANVEDHLTRIEGYTRLISPAAVVEQRGLLMR